MALVLKKLLLTAILLILAIWVIRYGWMDQKVETEKYVFTEHEIQDLNHFPKANYDFGTHAWLSNDLKPAEHFFRSAIAGNVLYIDAWLKLSQIETQKGNSVDAINILRFVHRLTEKRVKWKWPQILLALQLGQTDIFLKNTNFVLSYPRISQDAIKMLDLAYRNNTSDIIRVLDQKNMPVYLKWLMKEKRTDDSFLVWDAMETSKKTDNEIADHYISFLVRQKRIVRATEIQKQFLNKEGMTNPGFEAPLSNKGFGWRQTQSREDLWQIQRLPGHAVAGDYALRITFAGKQNIRFHHVRHIIPVQPLREYTLAWWWKSDNITTDQRPYLEVRGFDCRFAIVRSPMVGADSDWKKMTIDFSVTQDCHAVRICVRRDKSRRFDSKIKGRLWLDNFQLTNNK